MTDSMLTLGRNFLSRYMYTHTCMYLCVGVQEAGFSQNLRYEMLLRSILGTNIWKGGEGRQREEREDLGCSTGLVAETSWGALRLERPLVVSS